MQKILAATWKELLLWTRKPGQWILIFFVPILFIWLMQAVFGSQGTPVVTVYAVNEDKGQSAERVMAALRNASNLRVEELKTRDEANRRIGAGERMAAVIVPYGFSDAITTPDGAKIEIMVDPARSDQANIVLGLVNQALAPLIVDAEVNRGVENVVAQVVQVIEGTATPVPTPEATLAGLTPTPGDTLEAFGETSTPAPLPGDLTSGAVSTPQPDTLTRFFSAAVKGIVSSQAQAAMDNPQVTVVETPLQTSATPGRAPSLLDFLVPGYTLMFVFFLIPNLAMSVVEERQSGTLHRLLVAPVTRSQILLGKLLPYWLIAAVQFAFMLLVSRIFFAIDLGRSFLALAILILASSLAMASLGILIAAFARTETQASGLSVVIVLIMAVVSGAMFPSIFIPGLQAITPHYWAIQGFLNVVARGQDINGVLLPAGVLLTMSAVFFTAGAVRFRFEE